MRTGKTKYGHERKGNTRHGETELTLLPHPERRVPHHTPSNGEGGMGALEASRGRVQGWKASRAAPVPGPTADWGAWAAIADQGIQETMAGPPPRPR